jgi:hypothetical protein
MRNTRKVRLAVIAASGLMALSLAGTSFAAKAGHTRVLPAGRAAALNYLAGVEGVTPAVLQQDLKQGQTLLQIANGKYASADALATVLLAPVKTRLDAAVTNHQLTSARETKIYNRLLARVDKLVTTPHPFGALRHPMKHGVAGAHARPFLIQTLAPFCKTTPAALQAAFKAGGKTPLAICQATNPSVTQETMVSTLVSAFKTRIEARAKSLGFSLNPAREQKLLARIQARLGVWVVAQLPTPGGHS